MSTLIAALDNLAQTRPQEPFLAGSSSTALSFGQCAHEVQTLATRLDGRCLGLLLDNDPAFAIADLAAIMRALPCVPIPPFFSPAQMQHTLKDAGIDLLLTDQAAQIQPLCDIAEITELTVAGRSLALCRIKAISPAVELTGIAKVTYTSGTTGTPKGVCLSLEAMEQVAHSLAQVTALDRHDNSLALLPLSTLLENIGSLYAPLLAGARCQLPSLREVGLQGAARLVAGVFASALQRHQPTGIILIPQMLQALVEMGEAGHPPPESLRFIAVGGAPVAESLLWRAERLGLPVFEGYGLSEAASVVCLNRPGERRNGTVGRPLPHARVQIANDGEVVVAGALFNGYLGEDVHTPRDCWPTGDLGFLDADGFLHLTGRKKNIFITAFGRNVAPEWVECELQAQPAIAQAVVFGEAKPFNVALIVPRPTADVSTIATAVANANAQLPDYARIGKYRIIDRPFSVENGQLTATSRPRRMVIQENYRNSLNELYAEVASNALL